MLILALGGVLVGFVFLVVSLVTENSAWAWGCIVACVAAGVVLLVDTRRRRQGRSAAPAAAAAIPVAEPSDVPTEVGVAPVASDEGAGELAADRPTTVLAAVPVAAEPVRDEPAVAEPASPVQPAVAEPFVPVSGTAGPVEPEVEGTAEPDEEDADASDVLVVAGLEQEVLVVDEHPRFHVPACTWLVGRTTMGLPAREAVELGFSPCSRCAPSRTLAALTRA